MKIRRGESIFNDFEKEDRSPITSDEIATYEIRDSKGNIVVIGNLENINDVFELRIKGEDTNNYNIGLYTLLVKYENTNTGYSDYIMDEPLKVIS